MCDLGIFGDEGFSSPTMGFGGVRKRSLRVRVQADRFPLSSSHCLNWIEPIMVGVMKHFPCNVVSCIEISSVHRSTTEDIFSQSPSECNLKPRI